MYWKILLFSIMIGYATCGACQQVITGLGAGPEAMGSTATAHGLWSTWRNPAGLTGISHASVGFANQRLSQNGLMQHAALVAIKLGAFRSGLAIASIGDDLFRESALSIALSHKIGLHALGIRADWLEVRVDGERPRRAIGFSFGSQSKLNEHISLCISARNVNLPEWESDHPLPTYLSAGVAYRTSSNCQFIVEVAKETTADPSLRTGAEFGIRKRLMLRTGYQLHPNTAFAGLGLIAWRFHFDYAIRFAYFLGFAHQLSVTWQTRKTSHK